MQQVPVARLDDERTGGVAQDEEEKGKSAHGVEQGDGATAPLPLASRRHVADCFCHVHRY